jgi:DUF971 family protein
MTQPELPTNSQKATLNWTGDSKIKMEWLADGHESIFTLAFLRRACPCARCKGWPDKHSDGFPKIPEGQLKNMHATAVHPVGRYAVQFMWSDGHMTGYYPYEYLRKICPCFECSKSKAK